MKKIGFLLLLLSSVLSTNGQQCSFNHVLVGPPNVVSFTPTSFLPFPNTYVIWDYGDGTVDTATVNTAVTHTYPFSAVFNACMTIVDSSGMPLCTFCNSVYLGGAGNCNFLYTVDSVNTLNIVVVAAAGPGQILTFDFGDSTIFTGNSGSHLYSQPGVYQVCASIIDSATGIATCTNCQNVTVGNSQGNCTFTAFQLPSPGMLGMVQFEAFADSGSSISWDFGDGTTGVGGQTVHTYAAPGTYQVCMVATNPVGVSCTSCHPVVVFPNSNNCFFSSMVDSVDLFTFHFSGFPAYASGTTLSWDFGDGLTGNGLNASHTYAAAGTYQVNMLELDSAGSIVCSSMQAVTVPGFGGSCTIAAFQDPVNTATWTFVAVGTTPGASVSWTFSDGQFGIGDSISRTFFITGPMTVCMSESDPLTGVVICQSCTTVFVTGNGTLCTFAANVVPGGNAVAFSASANTQFPSVSWDFGDGNIGSGFNIVHTYAQPGVYNVCMYMYDSLGLVICTDCQFVTVNGNQPFCAAYYLSNAVGLTSYFIDLSTVNVPTTSYFWDFGDNSTSTNRFPQHTYAAPGTYSVCLTVNDSGCSNTYCSPVTVDTIISNPTTCQAVFMTLQLAPYQVAILNLSSGTNLTFNWDFGDGTNSNQPYPSHYYNAIGSYVVCLTVSDNTGCTSTYCDTLTVDSLGNVFRLTNPGFTVNVMSPSMLTGVEENESPASRFIVYPNPADAYITIERDANSRGNADYRIMTLTGMEVVRGEMSDQRTTVNTGLVSSGIYLIEIIESDGSRGYRQLLKQ